MKIGYAVAFDRGNTHKRLRMIESLYPGKLFVAKDPFGRFSSTGEKIIEQLNSYKPDLIVCREYPWPFWKYAYDNHIPYIIAIGDSHSMRGGIVLQEEITMIQNAEAILLTSEDHLSFFQQLDIDLPPHEVVYLRPSIKNLRFDPLPKLPGKNLVYAGGIRDASKSSTPFGYRSYKYIFEQIIKQGWNVHIYAKQRSRSNEYQDIGCIWHPPVKQSRLYRELSQYTAGFVGYNTVGVPEQAVKYAFSCRPNKLWEYLAGGIPTIGYQVGNGGAIFDGKWGTVLDDLASINQIKLPQITNEMRYAQTSDQDKPRVKKLIDKALKQISKGQTRQKH